MKIRRTLALALLCLLFSPAALRAADWPWPGGVLSMVDDAWESFENGRHLVHVRGWIAGDGFVPDTVVTAGSPCWFGGPAFCERVMPTISMAVESRPGVCQSLHDAGYACSDDQWHQCPMYDVEQWYTQDCVGRTVTVDVTDLQSGPYLFRFYAWRPVVVGYPQPEASYSWRVLEIHN